MNSKPVASSPHQQRTTKHAQILADWIEAAFRLHENYKKLVTCLDKNKPQSLYIGQCPIDQLVLLLANMQKELEKLLVDMDQLDALPDQPSPKKNYKKLATHTTIINHLNNQAKTRLLLTTFTTA